MPRRTHHFKYGKIFALLIGIDEYEQSSIKLSGCANDCEEIICWLNDSFQHPSICFLRDQEATRASILQHITDIANDDRIQPGDPILIYYAGYGMEIKPLEEWNLPDSRTLQMRMPYTSGRGSYLVDKYSPDTKSDSQIITPCQRCYDFRPDPSSNPNVGRGIFDRELAEILAQVSSAKGDNIIVILDSCHSASRTRHDVQGYAVRGFTLSDDYAWRISLQESDFSAPNAHGLDSTTPGSHVLLAACRGDQIAVENRRTRRGLFTERLIEQLNHEIRGIQTPYCEGLYKNRLLFSTRQKYDVFEPIDCKSVPPGKDLRRLPLGASHGVKESSRFLLFHKADFYSACLGEGVVEILQDSESFLQVPPDTPPEAFALKISPVNEQLKRVEIADPDVRKELGQLSWFSKLGLKLVDGGEADLRLAHDKKSWFKFEFLNNALPLDATFFHPWPEENNRWVYVLQQMGHYYYYLDRTTDTIDTTPLLEVKLMPVDPSTLLESGPAVETCHSGHMHVLTNDGKSYGIKVINTSEKSLYFALFYFSQCKFRIDTIYNPPTVDEGQTTPCLQPGESKTIGYGTPGDIPFSFSVPNGQKSDVGYLKLFYSDQYLDLQHITCANIFWPSNEYHKYRHKLPGHNNRDDTLVQKYGQGGVLTRSVGTVKLPIFQLSKEAYSERCNFTS